MDQSQSKVKQKPIPSQNTFDTDLKIALFSIFIPYLSLSLFLSFTALLAHVHRKLNKSTTNILASSIMVNAGAVCLLITASMEGLESAKASRGQIVHSGLAMKIHTSLKFASEVNGLCTSTKLRSVSECREIAYRLRGNNE